MRIITVRKDQSLMDIALQEYGDVYATRKIVEDNNLNSIVSNVFVGKQLLIRDAADNAPIKLFLAPYKIATLFTDGRARGIGFWSIGGTFKVS